MKITSLIASAALLASQSVVNAAPAVTNLDELLSSRPGPNYALTNNFGTTDPVWVPIKPASGDESESDLSTRATCNGPHVEMFGGGQCSGTEIRHLTLSNKKQCYDSQTNPLRGFSSANIDGYPGSTGTNYVSFYRGGQGNFCSSGLYTLVNFVGCAEFNDGFYYANGVTWDCN
ncbi:hypothetical protein E1B28_009633 [Marasmius oreades]|uniref:Uncharacterized protein n=1 Tax=Marasmius oreades TaxID=181124 RepID=A0A9P7RVH8_9AGAR|nr:uncharacterized protein E1B28_009633 [Marasmius oreades]KAG7090524.1 hypothetical protein E1B28_009633 [Marasmius oreades]